MPKTFRPKRRDDREYDTTQLRLSGAGSYLHRDYTAHFFRWSFARRMIDATKTVLDIGCGQDRPLSRILIAGVQKRVDRYVGVDLNPLKPSENQWLTFHGEFNFVERWRELLRSPHTRGFDVLVCNEVIEHMSVKNGRGLLRGAYACAKPGGVLLLSTPCYDGKRHAANHIHEYTVPELHREITRVGFVVENRFGTFMDVKHIGDRPDIFDDVEDDIRLQDAIRRVNSVLSEYFDNDALSNFFAPIYHDRARNNLWVCRRPS